MSYATVEDIRLRCKLNIGEDEEKSIMAMLEDAGTIVDAYRKKASSEAKKLVTCNMIVRALGNGEEYQVPIGTTQGTVSGLGYSQTWTMGSGSTGELYLTKTDKMILGTGKSIGFLNPLCEVKECSEE